VGSRPQGRRPLCFFRTRRSTIVHILRKYVACGACGRLGKKYITEVRLVLAYARRGLPGPRELGSWPVHFRVSNKD